MILTAVIFIQFRTIDQIDVGDLRIRREDELRTGTALLRTAYEEVMQRIYETNEIITEYQEIIASGEEASHIFQRELQRSQDLVRKK